MQRKRFPASVLLTIKQSTSLNIIVVSQILKNTKHEPHLFDFKHKCSPAAFAQDFPWLLRTLNFNIVKASFTCRIKHTLLKHVSSINSQKQHALSTAKF